MWKHLELFKIPNPFYRKNWDPRGFQGISNLLRLHVTYGNKGDAWQGRGPINPHWIVGLHFGNGAGYVWGRTLFLACNALERNPDKGMIYKRKAWDYGLTQNANRVPFSDGL